MGELNEERIRMNQELEQRIKENQQQQTSIDNGSNPHEIDELSREIARLNEELEKFKGKYFDSEQQKIELADQLDEIKEEKYKMEEKLEDLAQKISLNEEMRENDAGRNRMRNGGGHNRKTTAEWNDLVQKLREEKENQEAQYEEEFREFERMANEKVVQLEEYYVQQLQMKEVHVQQLQAQLQQQLLVKQQLQQQSMPNSLNTAQVNESNNLQTINQLNEEINNLK